MLLLFYFMGYVCSSDQMLTFEVLLSSMVYRSETTCPSLKEAAVKVQPANTMWCVEDDALILV